MPGCLGFGVSFAEAMIDITSALGDSAELGHRDRVQCTVELAIAAAVQSMTVAAVAGDRDRRGAVRSRVGSSRSKATDATSLPGGGCPEFRGTSVAAR